MKVEIRVTLRENILDPQGKAVENSIKRLDIKGITNARVGRFIIFDVDTTDKLEAQERVDKICDKLLVNPIIEDYEIRWL